MVSPATKRNFIQQFFSSCALPPSSWEEFGVALLMRRATAEPLAGESDHCFTILCPEFVPYSVHHFLTQSRS
ncbi:hypothetical protein Dimus_000397 [Dionaea muscipula]